MHCDGTPSNRSALRRVSSTRCDALSLFDRWPFLPCLSECLSKNKRWFHIPNVCIYVLRSTHCSELYVGTTATMYPLQPEIVLLPTVTRHIVSVHLALCHSRHPPLTHTLFRCSRWLTGNSSPTVCRPWQLSNALEYTDLTGATGSVFAGAFPHMLHVRSPANEWTRRWWSTVHCGAVRACFSCAHVVRQMRTHSHRCGVRPP